MVSLPQSAGAGFRCLESLLKQQVFALQRWIILTTCSLSECEDSSTVYVAQTDQNIFLTNSSQKMSEGSVEFQCFSENIHFCLIFLVNIKQDNLTQTPHKGLSVDSINLILLQQWLKTSSWFLASPNRLSLYADDQLLIFHNFYLTLQLLFPHIIKKQRCCCHPHTLWFFAHRWFRLEIPQQRVQKKKKHQWS